MLQNICTFIHFYLKYVNSHFPNLSLDGEWRTLQFFLVAISNNLWYVHHFNRDFLKTSSDQWFYKITDWILDFLKRDESELFKVEFKDFSL